MHAHGRAQDDRRCDVARSARISSGVSRTPYEDGREPVGCAPDLILINIYLAVTGHRAFVDMLSRIQAKVGRRPSRRDGGASVINRARWMCNDVAGV